MFERGFIGPIGDDLPSLIPIVTGLVIFFSIFVLTLNTYNDKNLFIEKQIDMTSVARDLKGDSLILNWDQFDKRCSSMKIKRYPYSFIVAIYSSDIDLKKVIEDFKQASQLDVADIPNSGFSFLSQPNEAGGQKSFYCSYLKIGGSNFAKDIGGELKILNKEYSVRFYPIAVQQPIQVQTLNANATQNLIVPAVMAMVVWE